MRFAYHNIQSPSPGQICIKAALAPSSTDSNTASSEPAVVGFAIWNPPDVPEDTHPKLELTDEQKAARKDMYADADRDVFGVMGREHDRVENVCMPEGRKHWCAGSFSMLYMFELSMNQVFIKHCRRFSIPRQRHW